MSFPGFALYSYGRRDLPRSYEEARALFEKKAKNPRWTGRLAHNTFLLSDDPNEYVIRLHDTDIVTFYPDGRVRLSTGGWQTPTTRNRLRRAGFDVGTTGGVASLRLRFATGDVVSWTFADGMIIYPDGNVHYPDPKTDPNPTNVLRRRNRNRRRSRRAAEREDWASVDFVPCDSRQSSVWRGGNVPEAFEREEAAA